MQPKIKLINFKKLIFFHSQHPWQEKGGGELNTTFSNHETLCTQPGPGRGEGRRGGHRLGQPHWERNVGPRRGPCRSEGDPRPGDPGRATRPVLPPSLWPPCSSWTRRGGRTSDAVGLAPSPPDVDSPPRADLPLQVPEGTQAGSSVLSAARPRAAARPCWHPAAPPSGGPESSAQAAPPGLALQMDEVPGLPSRRCCAWTRAQDWERGGSCWIRPCRTAPARHRPDGAHPASAAGAPVAFLKQGHPPSSLYEKLEHLSKPLKPSEVPLPTHRKGQDEKDRKHQMLAKLSYTHC